MFGELHTSPARLLDEPSLGLAPLVVHTIFEAIDDIRSKGTTILLVEQNANAALHHSDRAYVMETGGIVMEALIWHLCSNHYFFHKG